MASDISVTNALGGTTVPIATLRDATNSVASVHLSGYSVGGVATLVDSSHPLPITVSNFPATQPVNIASVLGDTQSEAWIVGIKGGNATAAPADSAVTPVDLVPVNVALNYIVGAMNTINSAGTTGTATYANMKQGAA